MSKISDDILMVLANTKRTGGTLYNFSFRLTGYGVCIIVGSVRDDTVHGHSRYFTTSSILSVSPGYVETHNTLYKLDRS